MATIVTLLWIFKVKIPYLCAQLTLAVGFVAVIMSIAYLYVETRTDVLLTDTTLFMFALETGLTVIGFFGFFFLAKA